MTSVIAIDLGASSGRLMHTQFDGKKLTLEPLHRFPNEPVFVNNTLYWDVLRLWHEISNGLRKRPPNTASIGVDTWGVDFAFLDKHGQLLANPVHYRDRNRDGIMDWVFERVPRREIFEKTGLQFMQLNGLYQLAYLAKIESPILTTAETMLTLPDLFNYWLTGSKQCEFTHASTLQIYNPTLNDWDRDLLERIGVPTHFLTNIAMPGTHIGDYEGTPVYLPACHDTGSAVVAVPTTTKNYAYLSSGTWSLLGLELDEAVISDASYEANVTNEGGFGGTFRFLKNIMGTWMFEQSLDVWRDEGRDYNYAQCRDMTQSVDDPFRSMVDPDDIAFFSPGDMPARIREYCQQTNQPIPETDAQILATIQVSLAMKYRLVLEMLEQSANQQIDRLHIIGGGSQNGLLCQMTSNAIGRLVLAGPVEATAMGNAIVQYIGLGEIGSLAEARDMLSRSIGLVEYTPTNTSTWNEHFERFKTILSESNVV